jgi:very-short-patch-repair endonuclease
MSELELVVQEALVAAGLPAAVQQHPVTLPNGRTAYLDLAYVDPRVDIEIDHSEWHATPSAVEHDKARDLGLAVLGWERLRLTERSIERRLKVCIATICAVLDRRRPAGPG